jgi:hypothetical protein
VQPTLVLPTKRREGFTTKQAKILATNNHQVTDEVAFIKETLSKVSIQRKSLTCSSEVAFSKVKDNRHKETGITTPIKQDKGNRSIGMERAKKIH